MKLTTTNVQKHSVWERVSEIFSKESCLNLDAEKCRKFYSRLKIEAKKTDDSAIDREYKKACAATGGGTGPGTPDVIDGDDIDINEVKIDDIILVPRPVVIGIS